MTVLLYNYLYYKILFFNLNHFFCYTITNLPISARYNQNEEEDDEEEIDDFQHSLNETIQFALVSKNFYQNISTILTNIMKFKNYDVLLPFIERSDSVSSSMYSLIKLKNSVKIYQSLNEYELDESLGLICNYRKCIVTLENYSLNQDSIDKATDRSIQLINSSKEYPENVCFNVEVFPQDNGDYDFTQFDFTSKKKISILYINLNENIKVDHMNKIFENLNKLNANLVVIDLNDYNYYLDTSLNNSIKSDLLNYSVFYSNPNLKQIDFYQYHTQPKNILGINNTSTSLKQLVLTMKYNEMIYNLNVNYESIGGQIQKDWDDMINILLNNKSIKYLVLDEFEADFKWENNFKTDYLTNGIKSILANPSCNIQSLEINAIKFLDNLFIQGLIENKSLSTLIFINIDPTLTLEKILLSNNKTIRNLSFYDMDFIQVYNSLFMVLEKEELYSDENINNNYSIDLYSVTLNLYCFETHHLSTIQHQIITARPNFFIREFNIYLKKEDHENLNSSQIIINNTIINFRYK